MAQNFEISAGRRRMAGQVFDFFCNSQNMKEILSVHTVICDLLKLKPNRLKDYYPKLKLMLNSWKAHALFQKFDERLNHKEYQKGTACLNTRVLIIGAGPAGLKMAIECQLLGAKVVLIEKRDDFSRNNVIHLWPFVIQDLNNLGAKTFYGKFCAGSINHISIRQLQFILLKMALLLGVEIHTGVAFEDLVWPELTKHNEGWRALVEPSTHPVSQYEFDVLIGADGRRNSLRGFEKNVLRTKLCIGITVNFINRNTEEEAAVNEIGGLSYIFAQQFFKDIESATGIDLENITYYKDETHYFVMTAKKKSLLKKGVLLRDFLHVPTLLSKENVSRKALMKYALEAAQTATKGQIPNMTFALNHCGEPDIAIFDFSTSYSSENASIVHEVLGKRLLCQLIGDSLMEPFWPTGSGCARCFLSAMDAAWAVRSWAQPQKHPLLIIAERESIYRLLPQTTANNLHPNIAGYTLDPMSRYPNLNPRSVTPASVKKQYLSDQRISSDTETPQRPKSRENVAVSALLSWAGYPDLRSATSQKALWDIVSKYRPDLLPDDSEETGAIEDFQEHIYDLLERNFDLPPQPVDDCSDEIRYRYLLGVYHTFKGEVPCLPRDRQLQSTIMSLYQSSNYASRPVRTFENVAEPTSSSKRPQKRHNTAVSTDTADFIRKQIGKLDINDISQLARLMEGHDALSDSEYTLKHQEIQDQIIALLDPDESPDPQTVRDAITGLLQGSSKTKVAPQDLSRFFDQQNNDTRPSRSLKGLGARQMSLDDSVADFPYMEEKVVKKLVRSHSDESPDPPRSDIGRRKNSDSMVSVTRREMSRINEMRDLLEGHFDKKDEVYTHRDIKKIDADLRQQFADIIEGKTSCVEPKQVLSIGNTDVAEKRLKIAELLLGAPRDSPRIAARRSSWDVAFRMQRVTDMMAKNTDAKLPKDARRKDRKLMRERVERSLHLLTLGPPAPAAPTDLEHDYGLQQYRADAPHFDERVKKLERQLQHYVRSDESAIEPIKTIRGGNRVAQLAAELKSTDLPKPKPVKPKDLLRAIGKISQDDWQVKQIEGKINENRFGRPLPSAAQRVPKWDREQFLQRQSRIRDTGKQSAVDNKPQNTTRDPGKRATVGTLVKKFHEHSAAVSSQRTPQGPPRAPRARPNEERRGRSRTPDDSKHRSDRLLETGPVLQEPAVQEAIGVSDESDVEGVVEVDALDISMLPSANYDASQSSSNSATMSQVRRKRKRRQNVSSSSSEMESDDEDTESSDDDEESSATEVSTDSEFACEEIGVNIPPPEILVTEAPPHISPPQDYPLSRTKSAGGLATKRALELKRKYLLGESSPPAVRKSESTSQLDTKLEAFRLNITEFQKLLHPATPTPQTFTPILSNQFAFEEKKPPPDIPDIIKNICNHVPVDLLTKGDSILDWKKPFREERDPELETDSLSDDSSTSDTAPNQSVPRLEVHNEGGELIQLDSLILVNNEVEDTAFKAPDIGPSLVAAESESSESCKEATTLALTETELSDWATEIVVIDESSLNENGLRKRNKTPRALSGPKLINDSKNIESSHVCGRDGPDSERVVYSNATEYFEFADEGDQDPTIEAASTPCNEGYMELVDDDYDPYSASRDRSINFIERVCSDTTTKSDINDTLKLASNFSESIEFMDSQDSGSIHNTKIPSKEFSLSYQKLPCGSTETYDYTSSPGALTNVDNSVLIEAVNDLKLQTDSLNLSEISPPLLSMADKNGVSFNYCTKNGNSLDDVSPSILTDSNSNIHSLTKVSGHGEKMKKIRNYSPAICRSVSENFGGSRSKDPNSSDSNWCIPSSEPSRGGDSTYQLQSQKVEELKREREEQTEVVRRLVLQRLGGAKPSRKSTSRSRSRVLPSSMNPPPVPPPPILPTIFSEVPPRPASQPRLSLSMQSSFSDPELNREQRSSKGLLKSISNYFNKHLGPKQKVRTNKRAKVLGTDTRDVADVATDGAPRSHQPLPEAGPSNNKKKSIPKPGRDRGSKRLERILSAQGSKPEAEEKVVAEILQLTSTAEAHRTMEEAASKLKATWSSIAD